MTHLRSADPSFAFGAAMAFGGAAPCGILPPMSAPRLSVCLPTWNGEADLERLLPALARQQVVGGFELVAIDSSSTDRTRELLERASASVETIPQAEFRHGPSRNRCAARARGEVLVFLSQDALPADEHFLARLAAAFDDRAVAGACARILPHPSDDPLTARTALELPEAAATAEVRGAGAERPRFNDVASAIRASVFAELPFPDVAFGEDLAWAEAALAAGHRLAFVPDAVCWHAHAYGPREAFRRNAVDAAFHRERFGRRLRPGPVSVVRGIVHEVRADWRHLARSGGPGRMLHTLRSPVLRAAQVLGQFWGSRGPLGGS